MNCLICKEEYDNYKDLDNHIFNVHKVHCPKAGANRHSISGGHPHSPLDKNQVHIGGDGIFVRVLAYPDKDEFQQLVYKATMAAQGGTIDEKPDPQIVENAFHGGLNQCLEWVSVVFEISGVSRGLTHELVRTRKASFSQQTLRNAFMGENPNMRMPYLIAQNPAAKEIWLKTVEQCKRAYAELAELDIPYQDARTVLPIGTETYIVAEYPLSVFIATYAYRSCYMFYPEIVYLFRLMKAELIKVCPWLEPYIVTSCEKPKKCTYQGSELVDGACPYPWAKEDNRTWRFSK